MVIKKTQNRVILRLQEILTESFMKLSSLIYIIKINKIMVASATQNNYDIFEMAWHEKKTLAQNARGGVVILPACSHL
jgi:hypothetical protein